ncbi:heterokaryon incompatibility protein-domain-containing protein [Pseudoneurospora amorphoporcata]|uniref:Heterokaryon incompatibility protein-domain-containing protein n=1 Tax=Pseudoneurospora amorphoporcata TaxID=241081 RepID=A0AAN6SAX6_9PEZI|nr:heterokaryon incompatibility protein-domain-containing protein [Pseudoneurospora amorphoporcata]
MASLAPPSDGICPRCDEIMNNFAYRGNKPISVRSWRTLQLFCNLAGGFERFPVVTPTDWPTTDVWEVSTNMSERCPLCSFFFDCASKMGFSSHTILSDEISLVARLVPYRFTIGLLTPLSSSLSWTGPAVTETRVLELRKMDGKLDPHHRSADFFPPSWSEAHFILPVQTNGRGGQISDTVDYGIISEWLAYCQSTHQSCATIRSVPLTTIIPGLHLIDCIQWKIIPAEEMTGSTYVTLSYVWGTALVDPQSMQSSTVGPVLPNDGLPKVIRDAMEVVRCLGYRYLWVDRYCIPQGNAEVKHLQIQNMGKIYSLSDLTIIAAAGEDAEYGLPGVSPPLRTSQLWTTISHGILQLPVLYLNTPNWEVGNSVWASRGWTYQEALLSRRRLVFTDRNVFFQCQSFETVGKKPYPDMDRLRSAGCYIMPDPMFPPLVNDRGGLFNASPNAIWERLSEFAARTLSYEEDTLNAMRGILGVWREHGTCFLYGLPVPLNDHLEMDPSEPRFPPLVYDTRYNAVLWSLFWRDTWDSPLPRWASSTSSHPRRTLFPSWTWAGWRSSKRRVTITSCGALASSVLRTPNHEPIKVSFSFDDRPLDWIEDKEEIIRRSDASYFPTHLVITAEVFDLTITCKRRYKYGKVSDSVSWGFVFPPFIQNLETFARYSCISWELTTLKIPPGLFEKVEGNSHRLLGIPLFIGLESFRYSVHILLLRQVGEDDGRPIFERVNCFTLYEGSFKRDVWPPKFDLRRMQVRIR